MLNQDATPLPEPKRATTVGEVRVNYWQTPLALYGVDDPQGPLPCRLYSQSSAFRIALATRGSSPASRFGPVLVREIRPPHVEEKWSWQTVKRSVAVIVRSLGKSRG